MAIENQIESVGYANGADDAFNYIADDHPLAEEAIQITDPGSGQSVRVDVQPGDVLSTDFDIAAARITSQGDLVIISLENGGTIELKGPSAEAFAMQPPILIQPNDIISNAAVLSEPELTQDEDETALSVPKPSPGETAEYTIVPGQPLDLGFSLEDVEIIQTDNDIALIFSDASQITFVSLVDAAFSDSPPDLLQPDGSVIAATELIDLASDISTYAETFGDIETAAGQAGPPSFAPVTNYGDFDQVPGAAPINTVPNAPPPPGGSPPDAPEQPGPQVAAVPPAPPTPPPVPPIPPPPAPDTLPTIAALDAEVFEASFTIYNEVTVLDAFPTLDLGADLPSAQQLGLPGSSDIALDIDFGADGAALLQPVSFTSASVDTLNGLNLSSLGSAVSVSASDDGLTLTAANAEGATVFVVSINESEEGEFSYAFTLHSSLDHSGASSDVMALPFSIRVTDGDGSVTTGSFTVSVVDDDLGAVSEAEISLDVKEAGSDVLVAGSDTFETGLLANEFVEGAVGADGIRISGITFTDANGIEASAVVPEGSSVEVSTEFGSLSVAYDGTWSFTSLSIDGLPVSGTLDAGFSYTVTDNDGDTAVAEQPISIQTNDVPTIAFGEGDAPQAEGGGIVDEDDILTAASLGSDGTQADNTLSQPIQVNFGANGAAAADAVVFSSDSISSLNGLGLSSNGDAVEFSLSDDGLTIEAHTNEGAPVFTMEIADQGDGAFNYTFTLTGNVDHEQGAGENILAGIPFSVVATDADGDTASGIIRIDVRDDVPTAVDDVQVTLTEATASVSSEDGAANLLANDTFGADRAAVQIQSFTFTGSDGEEVTALAGETVTTQFGQLTVNADGSWSYQTGDAANTLIEAVGDGFTYTIVDGDGDTSTAVQDIQLDIPVDESVSLTVSGEGSEDQPIPLDIDVVVGNPALFSLESVVLSGIPEGGSISVNGIEQQIEGGSLTVAAADLENVVFQAPEHSGEDQPINATAILSNTITGEELTAETSTSIVVRAVADGPNLDTSLGSTISSDTGADEEITGSDGADELLGGGGSDIISGADGNDVLFGDRFEGDVTISLNIDAELIDQDGSESLYVMVAGFPESATLTNADGETIELTDGAANLPRGQLGELTVTVPQTEADFTVSVSAQTTDVDAEQTFTDTSDAVYQSIDVSPSAAAGFGNDTLDGGAGEDQVFGEAGDDRGIFTVGEGGSTERYDGGIGDDTLVIRFTDADLENPDVLRELQEIREFIVSNSDTTTDSGAERTFEALGLTIQDWERVELDGPDLPGISVADALVAEDDLTGGSDPTPESTTVSQAINVDFKVDGAAESDALVFTQAGVDSLNSSGLTSNGNAVVFARSDDGLSLTGSDANGSAVAMIAITGDAENGFAYEFSLLGNLDQSADALALTFEIVATDANGDSATTSFDVTVIDDAPVAVDENAISIDVTGAGAVLTVGADTVESGLLANDILGADGDTAEVATFSFTNALGETDTAVAGETVVTEFGQLTVNADGTWTYEAVTVPADGTVADDFSYSLVDGDGDVSTAVQPITITNDDAPEILVGTPDDPNPGVTVDEDDLATTSDQGTDQTDSPSAGRPITIDFGEDGPADEDPVVFTSTTVDGLNSRGLTANGGQAVSFELSEDGRTVIAESADGEDIFTIEIAGDADSGFSYQFTLQGALDHPQGEGENTISGLLFPVQVTDGDGTQATASITINIVDDVPVAVDDVVQTITEAGGETGTETGSPNLLANDAIGADGGQIIAFTYTDDQGEMQFSSAGETVTTQFGLLTVNSDGTWSYQSTKAASNDPAAASDDFSYIVQDNDGDQSTATQPVVILDGPGPKITFGGDPDLVAAAGTLDEDDLANGSDQSSAASTTQSIEIDFGPDGPAEGDPLVFTSDTVDSLSALGLTTNSGQPVGYTLSEDGLSISATDPSGESVFEVSIGGSVEAGFSYTFSLDGNLDHNAADGENIISGIPFQIQATDGDGTTATASISIDVIDDVPQANDDQAVTINVDPTGTTTTSVDVAEFTHDVSNVVLYVRDAEGEITKVKIEAFPDGADGIRDIDNLDLEGFVAENYNGSDLVALTVKAGNNMTPGFGPGEGELIIIDPATDQEDLPVADHVSGNNTFTFQSAQAAGLGEGDGVLSFTESDGSSSSGIGLTVGSTSGGNNLLANDVLGADGGGAAIASFEFTNADGSSATASAGETVSTLFGSLTVNADGSWSYTTTSTPLDGSAADGFTYTVVDSDGDSSTASQPIQLGISVDPTAVVSIGGSGFEDERIDLNVEAALANPSPALTIAGVTISNIPGDATLFAADGSVLDTSSGSVTLTADQLPGLQIQAAADSGVDIAGLTATAHVENTVTGVVTDSTSTGTVVVQAVADGAPVTASAEGSIGGDPGTDDVLIGGGGEDTIFGGGGDDQITGLGSDDVLYGDVFEGTGAVALTIDTGLVDLDGSETLVVTIDGFPAGAALSNENGDQLIIEDSAIQLSQAQLAGLTLTAPEGTSAFTLDVTVQTFDFDADDNTTDPSQVSTTALTIEPFGDASPGDDTIEGGIGNDTIFGNEGDDVLSGNGSEEVIEINHEWTVTDPLPPMNERRELSEEEVNGVDPANLSFTADHPVSVAFISEGAGYQNTLGYYKVGPDGEISDVQFVFENASDNILNNGDAVELDIDAGDQINFFIVANGNRHNDYDNHVGGEYRFVDGDGNPATLSTDNPQLVYVGSDGSITNVNGPTYHTAGIDGDVGINPDGQQHSISGLNPETGGLQIAFEDLPALGDEDFNDLVIEVHAGPAVTFGTDDDLIFGNDGDDIIFGNAGNDTVFGDDDDPGEVPSSTETGSITVDNVRDTDAGFTVGARQVDSDGNLTEVSTTGISTVGNGIGVVGSPESGISHQLGFDPTEGASEQLVVSFDDPVTSADFAFRNLYAGEGDRRGAAGDEQGQWQVFNNGELVAEGLFTADGGNAGRVNIDTNGAQFDEIVFSATGFSGGQGDTVHDSSDYYITEINYARIVPGTSEGFDDTISGNDGNDALYGMQGEDIVDGGADNDVIDGGSSDDIVIGGTGQDWIMGGTDTGGIQISESMDVTLVGSDAGYDNSFGYFVAGDDGEPETGSVIWSNVNATEEGATHSIVLDGIDSGNVGFFIIPDGADHNTSLTDGTAVTFTRNDDGSIVAVADGEALEGQGAAAFFSGDAALNPDGLVHANESQVGGSQAALASATTDTVAEAILANDPVAFWRFGESGGTTAIDATGNHDGIYKYGVDTSAEGAPGDDGNLGAGFDGRNDHVVIPHSDAFQLETGTVMFSFNPADTNGTQGLFSRDSRGYDGGGHLTAELQGSRLVVRLQSDDESHYVSTDAGAIQAGQWHNIAFSFGEDGMNLYVDGSLVDHDDYTGGTTGNEEPIVIGAGSTTSRDGQAGAREFFEGEIDDVAIFDTALNAVTLGAIYEPAPEPAASAVSGGENGLLVELGFEDLAGGGDLDFNDLVVHVEHSVTVGAFESGDQIWGGVEGGTGDGEKDVFFFREGDGVDTIHDFEVGIDQLVVSGYGREDVSFVSDGNDTIVRLGDNEAVKLVGVTVDDLGGNSAMADHNADGNDDGVLSADELIDLREDLFDEEGGGAPKSEEAAVVFVAPVETGVPDNNGGENSV